MPFAAIMATTAAASRVSAGPLSPLATPLLALALVQTVVLVLAGGWAILLKYRPSNLTWFSRAKDHWPIGGRYGFVSASPGPRHARFGLFTIPVGLAVISIGLSSLHISTVGAIAALSAALLTTTIEMVAIPLGCWLHHPRPCNATASGMTHAASGKWFLAPAALLSTALGLSTVAKRALKADHPVVVALAFLLWILGALGYLYLLAISTLRIVRYGFPRCSLSSWWIVAGCGGLAAGAGGSLLIAPRVSHIDDIPGIGASFVLSRAVVADASIGIWCIASLIMIPILLASSIWTGKKISNILQSLITLLPGKTHTTPIPQGSDPSSHSSHLSEHSSHLSEHSSHLSEIDLASSSQSEGYEPPPWPPTFSTGVYALGTSAIGHITKSSGIGNLGRVCDIATLALWLMSTAIAMIRWSPELSHYKYRHYKYRLE